MCQTFRVRKQEADKWKYGPQDGLLPSLSSIPGTHICFLQGNLTNGLIKDTLFYRASVGLCELQCLRSIYHRSNAPLTASILLSLVLRFPVGSLSPHLVFIASSVFFFKIQPSPLRYLVLCLQNYGDTIWWAVGKIMKCLCVPTYYCN